MIKSAWQGAIKGALLIVPLYLIPYLYEPMPTSAVMLGLTILIFPDFVLLVSDYQSARNPTRSYGAFGAPSHGWSGFCSGLGAITGEVAGWLAAIVISKLHTMSFW